MMTGRERLRTALDQKQPDRVPLDSGGFGFNTIHNIQAKTPLENVIAMIDAVKDFNGQAK
jgi:uroporphyrinogen-III decarboxylase